jgi:anti-sigma regulatory factor (Ser/Thr protein kinase)
MNGDNHDFEHYALLYGGLDEFLRRTSGFIEAGLESGEPVLVAIPGAKIDITRAALNHGADRVTFINMNLLGRNPGRIIPAVRHWVDQQADRRCRFIGEPIWPGRTECEAAEATRHEGLINLAFADASVTILCPYDTSALDPGVLADAHRTHPHLIEADVRSASDDYTDPQRIWSASRWLLPEPPPGVALHPITADLAAARHFTATQACRAGLSDERTCDLVLAANEAATNALLHARQPRELRVWRDDDRLVCEVSDRGTIDDPLVGRRRPGPDWRSGRGVWLMNQLCDLVELRSMENGTTVRLHMGLG